METLNPTFYNILKYLITLHELVIVTKLNVRNFKSYKELDIDFNTLNIIIGPNAAGKSNLFEIFKFLKKLASLSTLDQVFEQYNGFNKLCNALLSDKYILISISGSINGELKKNNVHYELQTFDYKIKIEHIKSKHKTIINSEELQIGYRDIKTDKTKLFKISRNRTGTIKANSISQTNLVKGSHKIPNLSVNLRIPQTISILKFPFDDLVFIFSIELSNLQYYKFDIDKIKNPVKYEESQKNVLYRDGRNFAVFFKNMILKNHNKKEKFTRYMRLIFDFYDDLTVDNVFADLYTFTLSEKYTDLLKLHSPDISDGTLSMLLLVTALYFQKTTTTFIEEPELFVHPALYRVIAEFIKEASKSKQIFITTHNPILIQYFPIESVKLIKKNKYGHSICSTPINNETVQTFLDNELNLGDLMIDNLL